MISDISHTIANICCDTLQFFIIYLSFKLWKYQKNVYSSLFFLIGSFILLKTIYIPRILGISLFLPLLLLILMFKVFYDTFLYGKNSQTKKIYIYSFIIILFVILLGNNTSYFLANVKDFNIESLDKWNDLINIEDRTVSILYFFNTVIGVFLIFHCLFKRNYRFFNSFYGWICFSVLWISLTTGFQLLQYLQGNYATYFSYVWILNAGIMAIVFKGFKSLKVFIVEKAVEEIKQNVMTKVLAHLYAEFAEKVSFYGDPEELLLEYQKTLPDESNNKLYSLLNGLRHKVQ